MEKRLSEVGSDIRAREVWERATGLYSQKGLSNLPSHPSTLCPGVASERLEEEDVAEAEGEVAMEC